jgi:hypothetical protein
MAKIDFWQGHLAEITTLLGDLAKSGSCEGTGGSFEFPSRDDYAAALRVNGALAEGANLEQDPRLAAIAQAHWHLCGSNSCTFASFLSEQREEYGWETHVITDCEDPRQLAEQIAEITATRLPEPEIEVISILLPELDQEADLGATLRRLSGRSEWEIREEGKETDNELGELMRIGVRTAVEFDHWSEVLGFGSFPAQANTRLAPFTELAIRAKPPKRPRRRSHRAFMADIDVDLESETFEAWWHMTVAERARRLASDQDRRGKAKVTFVLRNAAWVEEAP